MAHYSAALPAGSARFFGPAGEPCRRAPIIAPNGNTHDWFNDDTGGRLSDSFANGQGPITANQGDG
jgi:hypothetical protein